MSKSKNDGEIDGEIASLTKDAQRFLDGVDNTNILKRLLALGIRVEAIEHGTASMVFSGLGGLMGGLMDSGATIEQVRAWIMTSDAVWPDGVRQDTPFFSHATRMRPVWLLEFEKLCEPGRSTAALPFLVDVLSDVFMRRGSPTPRLIGQA
jgi:hypothetical protein